MGRQTVVVMCIFILAFVSLVAGKSPPPVSPWAAFNKPAFARSLGPPFAAPGMSSITVPFGPKSSPFFPKFIDPKAMISKKTEMVTDLLSGLKPSGYSLLATGDSPKSASPPILYTPMSNDYVGDMQELTDAEKIVADDKIKRGISGSPSLPFGTAKLSSFPTFGAKPSAFEPSLASAGLSDSSINAGSTIIGEPNGVGSKFQEFSDSAGKPKEMVPGMFGPFGPFGPYASVTEIPIPKSTIVPADFWLPSSIIPGPAEYTKKVSNFLDKLLESLASNKTTPIGGGKAEAILARSLSEDSPQDKSITARSAEDLKTISATKDFIVDSILSKLGELKGELIDTLNDFIVYQKTAYAKPSTKKFKPPSPFAALFAPPVMDPTFPFTQRIALVSQVFDMLSDLQKNLTSTFQNAIESSTDASFSPAIPNEMVSAKTNDFSTGSYETPDNLTANFIGANTLHDSMISDVNKSPNAYFQEETPTAKRDTKDEYQTAANPNENDYERDRNQYRRLVKMNMHQGYQSMPLGTIESVQAGGGSVPGHQGGGIKLLSQDIQKNDEKWNNWSERAEYFKHKNEGRHHHNRH